MLLARDMWETQPARALRATPELSPLLLPLMCQPATPHLVLVSNKHEACTWCRAVVILLLRISTPSLPQNPPTSSRGECSPPSECIHEAFQGLKSPQSPVPLSYPCLRTLLQFIIDPSITPYTQLWHAPQALQLLTLLALETWEQPPAHALLAIPELSPPSSLPLRRRAMPHRALVRNNPQTCECRPCTAVVPLFIS